MTLTENELTHSSPEIIQSSERQACIQPEPSVDMWSLGVLAHELLTGKGFIPKTCTQMPFFVGMCVYGHRPTPKYIKDVLCWRARFPQLNVDDRQIRRFLRRLLRMHPSKRMSIETALAHELFHFAEAPPPQKLEHHHVFSLPERTLTKACPCRRREHRTPPPPCSMRRRSRRQLLHRFRQRSTSSFSLSNV